MRRTLLVTTAFALALTGCGGGSDPDAGTRPEPTEVATVAVETGTEPGTDLSFGDPATLVWKPSLEVTGELELSVDAVAEQRRSVFDGWTQGEAMADARPYFVTVSLTNTGESDLAGQVVPLYLRDDRGTLGAPWTLDGDFAACQSGPLPTPFAPGDSAEICLVFLAPDGAHVEDVVFEPTEGYDPISWTGEVAAPRKKKPGRAARRTGRG
ncbi:conserved exported hypothetical protein [metagenome]|uniref:DUF4352 domain-containing protein n=1 Tax=metagenome TaxID=256318 RepID=A0A2P2CHZ4_9ZZZZ